MVIFINIILIFIIMFVVGNMIFVSQYKHLLVVLLSLEFIVLSLFFFFCFFFSFFGYNFYFLIVFLVFSVCEGVLGLVILISIIRVYGRDYFQSFNIL